VVPVVNTTPVLTGINGFYGAGSMERLPPERAIKAQIQMFKQLTF
jgi:predicted TIM-barrel enzyme